MKKIPTERAPATGNGRKVKRILNAFQTLAKEETRLDPFFQEIRTDVGALAESEKEALFRGMIEQMEILKKDIEPLTHAKNQRVHGDWLDREAVAGDHTELMTADAELIGCVRARVDQPQAQALPGAGLDDEGVRCGPAVDQV